VERERERQMYHLEERENATATYSRERIIAIYKTKKKERKWGILGERGENNGLP
jgi:hypothetical protein